MYGKGQVVLWSFREHDIQLDSPEDRRQAAHKRAVARGMRRLRAMAEKHQLAMRRMGVTAREALDSMQKLNRLL